MLPITDVKPYMNMGGCPSQSQLGAVIAGGPRRNTINMDIALENWQNSAIYAALSADMTISLLNSAHRSYRLQKCSLLLVHRKLKAGILTYSQTVLG